MNKRILELAEQCHHRYSEHNIDLEKFAELIIQECLDVMSKTSKEANERFTYMGDDVPTVVHQMKIKKHFGVEE